LREILCGGSAVPRSLSEAYREQVGLPILQAWGMTETSPVATTGRVKSTLADRSDDELADLRAAQGLAIPLVDLRIVEPGTDDEKWSERPLACVVPEGDEEITLEELKSFLAERVPKWWIPNDLEIIDEVPKTSVGKFSKKTLREQFAQRQATA